MSTLIRLGNLLIEPNDYQVYVGQRAIGLTYTEFRLLALLASQPERVWSRTDLIAALGQQNGDSRGLTMHIFRLRKKLAGSEPYTIAAVRKRGYALAQRRPGVDGGLRNRREEAHADA